MPAVTTSPFNRPRVTARRVALALVVAAAALVVAGLAAGSTGVEFGALAAVAAAWLVHDFARSAQATPLTAATIQTADRGKP